MQEIESFPGIRGLITDRVVDPIMQALTFETSKEKLFQKKYPTTPITVGHMVSDGLASVEDRRNLGENLTLPQVLSPTALAYRRLHVDLINRGNSKGACWSYSRNLRDIFNYMLPKLETEQEYEAHLISGYFGKTSGASHHWVGVLPKGATTQDMPEDEKKMQMANSTIFDGTSDQFAEWAMLDPMVRSELTYTPLLVVSSPSSDWRNYYHASTISPVEPDFFIPANQEL